MTSPTGARRQPTSGRAADPTALPGLPANSPRRGSVLLELVLALALVVLILGAALVGIWSAAGALEEGAVRFEAGLRLTRAEAARCGRRFRFVLRGPDGAFAVLWEPTPLTEPEQFVPYVAAPWVEELPTNLVQVDAYELTGEDAYAAHLKALTAARADYGLAPYAITFRPDGTSDSARIELVARGAEDEGTRAVIELDGLTGAVASRIVGPTEREAYDDGLP